MPCAPVQFVASSSLPVAVAILAVLAVVALLWLSRRWGAHDRAKTPKRSPRSKDISFDEISSSSAAGRAGKGASAGDTFRAKAAMDVFKEAFPEMRVDQLPLPAVPFALRVTETGSTAGKSGHAGPCLRVEVSGSVPLAVATELVLLLTVEDLSAQSAQHVFATVASLQDERTGLFVERAKLGLIAPPGLPHVGWREITLIPLANLQAPRMGRRRLRFSCLGVPASHADVSVIDPLLRSEVCCAAVAEFEAELPVKGYLEEEADREQAAGMILCVAWGFARAMGLVEAKVSPVISTWMTQAASLLGSPADGASPSLRRVMEGADKLGRSGGVGFLVACDHLARLHVPEAPLLAFELCCRTAREVGGSCEDAYALLRDGALAMGVDPDEFARLMSVYLAGPSVVSEEELVGLDPSWDKERIQRFLREQFGKWNARSGSAADSSERRKIANRLNALAKLRQKYR